MLFNSIIYIIFLLCVVPVFCVIGQKYRKALLLFFSYSFYCYWDWRFLSLIIISTVVDYIIGRNIHREVDHKKKKRYLCISLITNLTVLGIFKYYNFFIESFESLVGGIGFQADFLHINIILPIGISFYTFQTLSYTIDIYREKLLPSDKLLDFALFVGFFPQLVAGPIEKAKNLLPQLKRLSLPRKSQMKEGFVLVTVGMFKKVMIGDTCGKFVDHIFAEPSIYTSSEIFMALLLFSIQIYADFSGYSGIARGTAKFFGIELVRNFQQPYLSSNITEFWRRWHISLSSWLKEYVYIFALGGNRGGRLRTYFNIMVTMLLGGLWHGASWNFVIWGGIHGSVLVFHKILLNGRKASKELKCTNLAKSTWYILRCVLTFGIVLISWLFFRSHDLGDTILILNKFLYFENSEWTARLIKIFLTYAFTILIIDILEYKTGSDSFLLLIKPYKWVGICSAVWVLVIFQLLSSGRPMPFIYFQF